MISLFIVLMQNHVDVKEIYHELYGNNDISLNSDSNTTNVSLDDLLKDDAESTLENLNSF